MESQNRTSKRSFLFVVLPPLLLLLLLVARAASATTSSLTPAVISPQLFIEISNKLNSSHQADGRTSQNVTYTTQLVKRQSNRQATSATSNSSAPSAAARRQASELPALIKSSNKQPTANLSIVRQRWRQMELSLGHSAAALANQLRAALDELSLSKSLAGLSANCRVGLDELIDGLASQKLWAAQTMDASAKLPSGLLEGTLTELGHFDQCLGLAHHPSADGRPLASGQYCSVQIKPPLIPRARLHTICQRLPPLVASQGNSTASKTFRLLAQNSQNFYYAGLRLGLCTPSNCVKADIQLLLSAYLAKYELVGQVKSCQLLSDEPRTLDVAQQCIAFALSGIVLLAAVGTIVDLFSARTKGGATSAAANGAGYRGAERHQHRRAPNGKRWLYQVYRSPPAACQLHRQQQQPLSSPGLQRNPLASQSMLDLAATPSGDKNQILLGGQFSTLHSSRHHHRQPPDECHLDEHEEVMRDAIGDDELEEEEEAWIAEMERNQQASSGSSSDGSSNPLGVHNSSAATDASRRRKQRRVQALMGLIKAFVMCFSLRTNLRLIGRHAVNGGQEQQSGANSSRQNGSSNKQQQAVVTERNGLTDIKVIHGLRTITMIWIIFGHTIGLVNPEMMNSLFGVAQLSCTSRLLQALLNATLAVNTFFMISGLVTVISLARKCDSANRLLRGGGQQQQQQGSSRQDCSESQQQRRPSTGGDHHRQYEQDESSSVDSASTSLDCSSSSVGSSSKCHAALHAKSARNKRQAKRVKPHHSSHRLRCDHQAAIKRPSHQSSKQASSQSAAAAAAGWPKDFKPLAWLALRYLRLTPAYAATIGLSILMPLAGSGPFWQESAGQLGPACRDNWLYNLIYANNFINTDRLCLIHSWYLSNDWQFFIATILLLTIGYKSRRLAAVLLISALIGASAATYALTVANEFPPTIVSTSPAVAERWLYIHSLYYKPWPHLSSYLVGLLAGYALLRRDCIKLSKTARAICWLAAAALALALLNSVYPWNMGLQVEPHLAGLHSATFRTLWATCCAWLVFALATRPQAPLAKLLCWHGFQVSSRLTYCVYLVHPLIIYYHFGTLRERMDSSIYSQFHRFMATLGLSYLFALLLSLLVESPSIQLQRLVVASFSNSTGGHSKISSSDVCNRHRSSTCSGISENSWIGTSSFGEQSSATSSNLALVTNDDNSHHHHHQLHTATDPKITLGLGTLMQPPACCRQPAAAFGAQPTEQVGACNAAATQACNPANGSNTNSSGAVDPDFQRKLAQAISRGFRLRSKLANGTIKPSLNLAANAQTRQQQVKKVLAAAVPTPVILATERAASGTNQLDRQLDSCNISHHHQLATIDSCPKPKRVEFSTFFVGHPGPQASVANGQQQQQNLATAAVAERQRRRSHDLIMTRPHNHQHPSMLLQPLRISASGGLHQQPQPAIADEMMMRQQAALFTRSQNQLDQFNPRTQLG